MTALEHLRAIDPAARTRAARAGFWVVAGLLLLNLLFGDMGVLAGIRQRHAASQLRSEVASLQMEHDALAADIQALNSNPFRIESIAREELGLARPGEIIFLFPSAGASAPPASAAPPIVAVPSTGTAPSSGPATARPARPTASTPARPGAPTSARPAARSHHR
jgi:cell division protein FtsB